MKRSKKCPSGSIRNPATGRCVKRTGSIGRKLVKQQKASKRCPSGSIRNPATGRCVKRTGSIGRKLVKQQKVSKRCPSGSIRNPATGRCVKRTGSIGRKLVKQQKASKRCPSGSIRNPATGRCVKRTGSIGRKLVKQQKVSKRCPSGSIRNPATGRCVERSGAIGRRLQKRKRIGSIISQASGKYLGKHMEKHALESMLDLEVPGERVRLDELVNIIVKQEGADIDEKYVEPSGDHTLRELVWNCETDTLRQNIKVNGRQIPDYIRKFVQESGFVIEGLLGSGVYGKAYLLRNENTGLYDSVVKVMYTRSRNLEAAAEAELNAYKALGDSGIVPQLYAYKRFPATYADPPTHVFIIERMDCIISKIMEQHLPTSILDEFAYMLLYLTEELSKHGFSHNDMHLDNVALVVHDNRVVPKLIDLGLVEEGNAYSLSMMGSEFDIMVRTLSPKYFPAIPTESLKYLKDKLKQIHAEYKKL